MLFFDIEADGFLDTVTRIHCIAIAEDEGDPVLYHGFGVSEGVKRLKEADSICAHNGINYDCAVINKLFKVKLDSKCVDTLVLSQLSNPEREGGHSLANLSKCKDDYTGGFEEYNEEMGKYCLQDVRALQKVYNMLQQELSDWNWSLAIKLEHKVSQLISWQERNGWLFDVPRAEQFIKDTEAKIVELDSKLDKLLKRKCVTKGATVKPFLKTGGHSLNCINWMGDDVHLVCGEFSKVEFIFPDLGSRKQMIKLLQEHGWKPTEWTDKGNPKFTEDSIVGKLGETGQAMVDRFVCVTRIGQVRGWIEKVRADGRISAGANPNATPTARMRHRTVVNVPRVTSAYGVDLRSLFCVPSDHIQVGADASGLELRMLAHYMGDADYTDAIVNGKSSDETDVHSINCKLIGLEPKKQYTINGKQTSGRDIAKTFIYALLYGAGDEKLGTILEGDADVGKRLRKKFLKGLPKYAVLLDRIKIASSKGYLKGIDGRKIFIRHEHAALNSLLQSAGSICVKTAMAIWAKDLVDRKIPFKLLGTFHDEIQAETLPEYGDKVGKAFVLACEKAGKFLKVNCPLTGEYMIGKNWAECH